MERNCTYCHKEIHACFGFVMAGDFLKFLRRELSKEAVRELCGKCVFRMEVVYAEK